MSWTKRVQTSYIVTIIMVLVVTVLVPYFYRRTMNYEGIYTYYQRSVGDNYTDRGEGTFYTQYKEMRVDSASRKTDLTHTLQSGRVQNSLSNWTGSTLYSYYNHRVKQYSNKEKCQVPSGGFRAWDKGVVTSLEPEIPVNCSRVISRDKKEINRVKSAMSGWKNALSDKELMRKMENCSWLRDYFSDNLYNSKLEKSFPIAFTFVVYDSPQQVLRLLRLLYRPQNSYCIHCDVKSPHKAFFQKIANCFENVINPSKVENVVWGYYTIMEAQMDCMTDLLKLRAKQEHKWKYVINLCGKELPLRTNREIVTRLMKLNGSSSIFAYKAGRFSDRIRHKVGLNKKGNKIAISRHVNLGNPPFNDTQLYKSSSYNAISLELANYLIFNENASKIHNFFKNCKSSEEHFYATVYMMPGVPGGYNPRIPRNRYFSVSGAFWTRKRKYHCRGMVRHTVCIVAAGDLSNVVKGGTYLFHNKYFMKVDHTVMKCMEERIVARNKLEYRKDCVAK